MDVKSSRDATVEEVIKYAESDYRDIGHAFSLWNRGRHRDALRKLVDLGQHPVMIPHILGRRWEQALKTSGDEDEAIYYFLSALKDPQRPPEDNEEDPYKIVTLQVGPGPGAGSTVYNMGRTWTYLQGNW